MPKTTTQYHRPVLIAALLDCLLPEVKFRLVVHVTVRVLKI